MRPHVLLFPLMAQGHTIPMIDIARILAQRGLTITIVATPLNCRRFQPTIERSQSSGLDIKVAEIEFPTDEAGLPPNSENIDQLETLEMIRKFLVATTLLREPFRDLVRTRGPHGIVSDMFFPWTLEIAREFNIPRFVFHGTSCFSISVQRCVRYDQPEVSLDHEEIVMETLPHKFKLAKCQVPDYVRQPQSENLTKIHDLVEQIWHAEPENDGAIVNSFYELEPEYFEYYKQAIKKQVWTIGPVSSCNSEHIEKAERGSKAAIDEEDCSRWLDSKAPKSVIYVCFGSLGVVSKAQTIELGLGLEGSGYSFIWVVKGEMLKNLPPDLQERLEKKGLIIKGWAPQLAILSHPAIGGFVTHCGWNSILEAIGCGVPLLTWPMFSEQHMNERLVVDVLQNGSAVGGVKMVKIGEEGNVALVHREKIKEAVVHLMSDEETRGRAEKLKERAKRSMQEEGSSFLNVDHLIQFIVDYSCSKN